MLGIISGIIISLASTVNAQEIPPNEDTFGVKPPEREIVPGVDFNTDKANKEVLPPLEDGTERVAYVFDEQYYCIPGTDEFVEYMDQRTEIIGLSVEGIGQLPNGSTLIKLMTDEQNYGEMWHALKEINGICLVAIMTTTLENV